MKLLIVLSLLGAAFAVPDPIMLEDVEVPEFVDFGVAYVPDDVAREAGLELSDEPAPAHFINEDGDIQTIVDEAPVDAPLDDAPVEVDPVEVEPVDDANILDYEIDPTPFMYGLAVEEPVFEDAPETFDDNVNAFDDNVNTFDENVNTLDDVNTFDDVNTIDDGNWQ